MLPAALGHRLCGSSNRMQRHAIRGRGNAAGRVARAVSQQAPSLAALADVAGGTISRLQRLVQPPPPGFPPGPAGDQSVAMLAGPLEFISRLRRTHGPVVGMLLGGERVVLLAEPAAARQVLVGQPDVFVKAGTAFFPGSSLTGNGLLVSDGQLWRRQRRLSNPAFRKAAVDRYADAMVAATLALLDGPFADAAAANARQQAAGSQAAAAQQAAVSSQLSSSSAGGGGSAPGVRDVYADFNQLTLNITLAALFGMTAGGGSSSGADGSTAARIVAAVEKAFTYFAARGASAMVVPEWVPTPDNVAFQEAVAELDRLVYGIIDARQAEIQQQQQQQQPAQAQAQAQHAPRSDLLQALLTSVDEEGQPMSRTALRDELMTLLVAGQETSAILLGWAAALLAHHPKAQAAAAAEVAAVLGSGGATAADVGRLPVVTSVVLESLRLYSPAYMVGRCACRDVELVGGYRLPAGTTLLVSPFLLHREPSRWRQPGAFTPERWLPLLTGAQQQQQAPQQEQQQGGEQQAAASGCPVAHGSSSAATVGGSCPVAHDSSSDSSSSSSSSSAAAAAAAGGFMGLLKELGPNGAYLPFGGGPRNCIGTGFAMTEAVLVLALLLQRFELAPPSPAAGLPRPKAMLTLRPDAVPLRLLQRQPAAAVAAQQQQLVDAQRAAGASEVPVPAA